jgi:hypothetical protein
MDGPTDKRGGPSVALGELRANFMVLRMHGWDVAPFVGALHPATTRIA